MDLTRINDKKTALSALRKLGFSKSRLQMTRGAMTYTHPDASRFQITVADSHFITTGGGWSCISSAINIGNLKEGAAAHTLELLARMRALGTLKDEPLSTLAFGVAIATSALTDARQKAAAPVQGA